MKLKLHSFSGTLCIILLLQRSTLYSQQSCLCPSSPTNITISTGWPKTFNIGANDVIWDFEPFDANSDGTIDGYIVAGSADMGGSDGMNIHLKRLYPNGTEYTSAYWPKNIDGQNNVDAAYDVEITSSGQILVCGSKRTNKYPSPSPLPPKNKNVWLMKYNLDGTDASGWPAGGREYGGNGDDEAYSIKEDLDHNYVVAGIAGNGTDDVPSNAQGDGDYWVFKTNQNGVIITNRNKVYFGNNTAHGNDYARSIAVDCSTGAYIVSGFCKSCAPEGDDHSQLLLVKIPTNFDDCCTTKVSYGYDINNPNFFHDYGSYNVIQTYATLGSCTTHNGFLSLGLQHPNPGCYGGNHDFWAVKTDDGLVPDAAFINGCKNADYGVAYGGKVKDNGHSAVQICDGYLLAGITNSNNKAQSNCTACQVECNHYECTVPVTEDIWLAKINSDGLFVWDESLGGSGDDGAYSIKSIGGGKYVVAGYTTNSNGNKDWYIVKFDLTECLQRLSGESHNYYLLSVYPNPSNGALRISFELPENINEPATIEILDPSGRVVSTLNATIKDGLLEQQISDCELPSGFYWMRVIIDRSVYIAKLIIQQE